SPLSAVCEQPKRLFNGPTISFAFGGGHKVAARLFLSRGRKYIVRRSGNDSTPLCVFSVRTRSMNCGEPAQSRAAPTQTASTFLHRPSRKCQNRTDQRQ